MLIWFLFWFVLIPQARILEWVAISFSRGSSQPRDLPNPGVKLWSLVLQADSLPSEPLAKPIKMIVIVQLLTWVWLFVTHWNVAHQASLPFAVSQSLLKLMSIESVMPSNHLIRCHPLFLPTFNLSQHQGLFQWVSSSHQMAKVLEFQL